MAATGDALQESYELRYVIGILRSFAQNIIEITLINFIIEHWLQLKCIEMPVDEIFVQSFTYRIYVCMWYWCYALQVMDVSSNHAEQLPKVEHDSACKQRAIANWKSSTCRPHDDCLFAVVQLQKPTSFTHPHGVMAGFTQAHARKTYGKMYHFCSMQLRARVRINIIELPQRGG